MLLENAGVLITGGTGTFARAFIPACLAYGAKRIVCLARHEVEMSQLERDVGSGDKDQMRYYLGDVRDRSRLIMAMRNIDVVVHAAALKRIEQCERDPFEAIATNVNGSVTVVQACLDMAVKRCILLSTDKAVNPINLYGATKMCAERLFIAANGPAAGRCKFGVVRYGNVWASRGSVIHVWRDRMKKGLPIEITDPNATRFFMRASQAVGLVLASLHMMLDSPPRIAVANMPAYRIGDLVNALAETYGNVERKITGLPIWEKQHETIDGFLFSDRAPRLSVPELQKEIIALETTS